MPLLDYREIIEQYDRDDLSLMIGNGFSISACPDTFSYELLYRQADFGSRAEVIGSLFDKFGTYDFEEIMERLNSAIEVHRLYNHGEDVVRQLSEDQVCLKQGLVEAITRSHPNTSLLIDPPSYARTRSFISKFSTIFSLNYDLLLYWAINKTDVDGLRYCNTRDGFNRTWQPDGEQNVYYIHGGLHLFESEGRVHKISSGGIGANLIDQVSRNLFYGKFPLFVSEPTCNKKLDKIKHNPYLMRCYEKLRNSKGILFVHGHSLYNNDDHIIEAVRDSDVEKVYIGVYGDSDSRANIALRTKAAGVFGRRVDFYDSSTVPLW